MEEIKLGKYKHYKGNIYDVLGIARHSETLEEFVVYKKDNEMWARPKEMFFEEVEVDGEKVSRFEFIEWRYNTTIK